MLWVKLSWVELWVPQSLSANFCPIRQGCRRRSYNSVLQNFVAFIPSLSIRQIMANFSRIEFQSTSGKEKKIIVLCSRPPQNAVKTGLHAGVQWPQRIIIIIIIIIIIVSISTQDKKYISYVTIFEEKYIYLSYLQ